MPQTTKQFQIQEEKYNYSESFIFLLYTPNVKAQTSADELCYWMFCQMTHKNESMPPTSNSLKHPVERAIHQQ